MSHAVDDLVAAARAWVATERALDSAVQLRRRADDAAAAAFLEDRPDPVALAMRNAAADDVATRLATRNEALEKLKEAARGVA